MRESRALGEIASELVINGSIELSAESLEVIPLATRLLPFGMTVYLPKMLRRPLADNLHMIHALHAAGFDPVPHIAARQVASASGLRSYLDKVVHEFGVHRVLVIGGDNPQVAGPFADSAALIGSGILAQAGIHEIDVAGYPEGHPRIPLEVLKSDLYAKLRMAADQGLGINIITQFSFAPSRIVEYCDELAHSVPQVPVYVGLAGPTDSASLLRFARHCGVSESLRALSSLGVKAATLACHTSPDEQVEVLARYCAGHEASNVIGLHVFSFGGFARSAEWVGEKYHHA
jgi:methylenetetrahydrofolate reductase (NADPH)